MLVLVVVCRGEKVKNCLIPILIYVHKLTPTLQEIKWVVKKLLFTLKNTLYATRDNMFLKKKENSIRQAKRKIFVTFPPKKIPALIWRRESSNHPLEPTHIDTFVWWLPLSMVEHAQYWDM